MTIRKNGKNRKTVSRFYRLVLLLLPFVCISANVLTAQEGAINFWQLPHQKVEEMLLPAPDSNDLRYERLHQYFSDLHCTAKLMEEQTIDKHEPKNIICTVPGKDTRQIIVAANYQRNGKIDGVPQGWSEAVMLPLLYNALLSQQRQHTYVFAALYGYSGEKKFFEDIRNNTRTTPDAMIVLDAMSLGAPLWYALAPKQPSEEQSRVFRLLWSQAVFTRQLQKIAMPDRWVVPNRVIENTLLPRAGQIPAIVIFSGLPGKDFDPSPQPGIPPKALDDVVSIAQHMSAPAFHQDFDFVAYLLCKFDATFTEPLPASNQTSAR